MSGHHRIKNIDYDDDEVYSDNEEDGYGDEQEGAEYTAEDKDNFATLTPVVRAELEEAGIAVLDAEIQDALWNYYWDVAKSVGYLKNAKAPKQQQPKNGGGVSTGVKKEKPKSKFDEAAERSAAASGTGKSAASSKQAKSTGLESKTKNLKIEEATPSQPPQPKVKSKGLDVPRLYAESISKRKASAAFVVIGHVDHGKSTLMGRLLLDTGAVAQRDIDKFQKQAAEIGKSSFALAWVMDTGSDERERGVTVDIAQHHFGTEAADFTILDAPGHRDFVPNMIGGASMADVAVLVVDANQLESGMKGQTREHILLARAVGIKKVIVAVNKMDAATLPPWSEEAFGRVKLEVGKFLSEIGIDVGEVAFVPCSGLNGENVVKAISSSQKEASWVSKGYRTLLHELEAYIPPPAPEEQVKRPLRMQVADVFRGGIQNPLSVSGRISAGNVQVGDAAVIQPSGESATIKAIDVADEARDWAVAGQLCTLHLADVEAQHLRAGDLLCSAKSPVRPTRDFTVNVSAAESILPQSVDLHVGRLHAEGRIAALIAILSDDGKEVVRRKPRIVKEKQRARLRVELGEALPIEEGTVVVLRSAGGTVASGVVAGDGAT
ncbi:hypothetical protein K431DRAFT_286970 [Polychaeton citri CBS 116435]|uniref:Tr-type G domain-containing protein n=1 Tax=Polychaeton citri CBS 116435 TaxID=1314669 RepID=A0A9P4Q282_9PEZI|nr:hypothetical protein K431DRAFT_286970 [Polychaeton citri CBS 116435]